MDDNRRATGLRMNSPGLFKIKMDLPTGPVEYQWIQIKVSW